MRFLAIIVAAVALVVPGDVHAHSASWPIHKALCKVGLKCRDVPPRPGPQTACTPERVGDVERIWDERLGAYVEWECRCPWPKSCAWYRLRIVPNESLPWEPPERRRVMDWHRACKSVVCKRVLVEHRYPTRWIFGR